jgi:TetR/AcrR family transcriptional regulator
MADTHSTPPPDAPPVRKRPKPGERRVQILQALATMLEQPGAERITTAALAAKLDVSEAAPCAPCARPAARRWARWPAR